MCRLYPLICFNWYKDHYWAVEKVLISSFSGAGLSEPRRWADTRKEEESGIWEKV